MKKLISLVLIILIFLYLYNFFSLDLSKSDSKYENFVSPHSIKSFSSAKKKLVNIWNDHKQTFYCGCNYSDLKTVDNASCNYEHKGGKDVKASVQYEHIVPASVLGNQLACWNQELCTTKKGDKYKGRSCCTKLNKEFRFATADLYNLVPELSELNINRVDFDYNEINGEKRIYGQCDFEVDNVSHVVEPRDEIKGWIARTQLYMADTYKEIFNLDELQRIKYQSWDKEYPPSSWEITWAKRVEKTQGNINPYIVKRGLKALCIS